ncbi:MAG: hypothetical protein IPI59_01315 [Sphingobacteriales bacterium]|nr:hypothetical protein [Sphingobacteriales bacterium]MBP9141353.1 hypothetical protein [Chitinophagales bacterium]MDA0198031.1 hypothetical protein [Bacteroidota bacterium]MBK6890740.1 hypothetical protein [Sphingobacteriales bacterium]MBK7526208.1 hypothetical protein [Sphingobacteriales bacterium]
MDLKKISVDKKSLANLYCSLLGCLLTTWLLLSGCSYSTEWQTTTSADNNFQISLPAYLSNVSAKKTLHPTAQLQFLNYFRSFYGLVLDTVATTNKPNLRNENWQTNQYNQLVGKLIKPQQIDSVQQTIAGYPATKIQVTGTVGGEDGIEERIFYQLTFINTPTQQYAIIIWTLDKNREDFLADITKIPETFTLTSSNKPNEVPEMKKK